MSTVKATNFQHPSASAAGITLGSDGSVVLPSGFTGGLGTNVVQAVKTDTFTTSSTSYVDVTGLTATITPSSATSKVLIIADIKMAKPAVANVSAAARISGGNATNYIADSASNRTLGAAGWETGVINWDNAFGHNSPTLVYLDSPATTSPVTYAVQVLRAGSGAGSVFVNRSGVDSDSANYVRFASSITVIEVAA